MKLPAVSGPEAIAAFRKLGYEIDWQRGSHILFRRRDPLHRRLSIPHHKEPARGTLRTLIREPSLTVEDFVKLL